MALRPSAFQKRGDLSGNQETSGSGTPVLTNDLNGARARLRGVKTSTTNTNSCPPKQFLRKVTSFNAPNASVRINGTGGTSKQGHGSKFKTPARTISKASSQISIFNGDDMEKESEHRERGENSGSSSDIDIEAVVPIPNPMPIGLELENGNFFRSTTSTSKFEESEGNETLPLDIRSETEIDARMLGVTERKKNAELQIPLMSSSQFCNPNCSGLHFCLQKIQSNAMVPIAARKGIDSTVESQISQSSTKHNGCINDNESNGNNLRVNDALGSFQSVRSFAHQSGLCSFEDYQNFASIEALLFKIAGIKTKNVTS